MRTSFIVATIALTVAFAGTAEWASRRATRHHSDGTPPVVQDARGPMPRSPMPPLAPPLSVSSTDTAAASAKPSDGVLYTVVLGGGRGGFRLNGLTLSDDTIAQIDELFSTHDAELVVAHFVVEGHTDSLGSKDVNQKTGLARAIAVRQYLGEQYGIPYNWIRVVSYGADQPIGDNATSEGRALNRRVVIKVLK